MAIPGFGPQVAASKKVDALKPLVGADVSEAASEHLGEKPSARVRSLKIARERGGLTGSREPADPGSTGEDHEGHHVAFVGDIGPQSESRQTRER